MNLNRIAIYCVFIAFLAGCVTMNLDQKKATLQGIKTAASILSYLVIQNNPDYRDEVELFCSAALSVSDPEHLKKMTDQGKDYLSKKFTGNKGVTDQIGELTALLADSIKTDDTDFRVQVYHAMFGGFLAGLHIMI